jgi:hypothetical protein
MAATLFENNIQQLKFSFLDRKEQSGVVLTAKYKELDRSTTSPDVLFALEIAKEKFDADAVYFRYFDDGRGFVPQIYIYDNTNNHLTDKKHSIHIKVWSGCQVPIYIIIGKSAVELYDAREKAKDDKETEAYRTIQLVGKAIKEFTAKSFDDGLFWEDEKNETHFQFKGSAYRDLIDGLKKVYKAFQEKSGLDNHVSLKLLVQCLLIKYLEERESESKSGYFAETYFQNQFGCTDFCEVIRAGKLLELLDQLAEDFNGKIFEWDKEDEGEARQAIERSVVKELAYFLDAKIKNEQFVLWRLYSFSHLPVELISSVYEELLTNRKDIVYTPEMVVNTLVDECMPLKNPKTDFKLIDVSCGSGIFLVKAYKRIIQWWRYNRWQETGILEKPSLNTLKKLLLDSIYGVDIQEDAIRLSVFSLALALLDEVDLKPPVWQELKFPDLGKQNIIVKDFFRYITSNPTTDFSLVIGNPPFNPPKEDNGKPISNGVYFSQLKDKYNYSSEIKIPDENPALHFLVQAMKLLKSGAMLCLIQPSGPLLYQKDTEFKQALFSKYNLLQVLDFTKLADVLWGKKNVATAAVFLQNTDPDGQDVAHIVANRAFSNVSRLFLEFDHYDFHWVSKDAVLNSPFVWKANIVGGGRIISFLDRFSEFSSLGEFLKLKELHESWSIAEGFIEKGDKADPCDYITGHPYLPSECFSENKIIQDKIHPCKIQLFHRPKTKEIYSPPHLLIKENIGKELLSVYLSKEYLVFRANIIGINCPPDQIDQLQNIAEYFKLNNNFLRFFIRVTSSQLSISKATVPLKEDFMNLPYSENLGDFKLSESEALLVNEILTYQLNNGRKLLSEEVAKFQIDKFSTTFCQTLNSVYHSVNKAFRLFKVLDAGRYFAVHFEYNDQEYEPAFETKADLEEYIKQVIPTEKTEGKSFHIQRIIKIYGKDTIILAKPKQLRYWLPSIALRDADEAFADYIKARYQ